MVSAGGSGVPAQSLLPALAGPGHTSPPLLPGSAGSAPGTPRPAQVPHGVLPADGSLLPHLLDLPHQTPALIAEGDALLAHAAHQHGGRASARGSEFSNLCQ